ncbi:hypothetical protein LCGC14_2505760 [marine sediment metagenome]|uniref:IrrE N-terminal-like domain-containing protein n=1 Tax=marine sediment metagenome TaxID=412755 RepID=A0A0F9DCB4_9ZZZZ
MKRFVLPKKIKLPGGFNIKVGEVALTNDETSNWSYDMQGNGVIQLKKGMTQAQQKYSFSHELLHAVADYHHFMITQGGTR